MRRIILVLAFMLGTHIGCVQAQTTVQIPAISYHELTGYLGISFCLDGAYYSFIRDGMTSREFADVQAHEAKHREQYARFPGCAAVARWMGTPKGLLESEAEAYMAGLCVAVSMGADKITLMQNYADRINRILGGEVNRLTVLQTMKRWDCR